MAISIATGIPEIRTNALACDHQDLGYLGAGGDASYYRCRVCGAGVVEQRGRRWILRKR